MTIGWNFTAKPGFTSSSVHANHACFSIICCLGFFWIELYLIMYYINK